MSRAAADLGRQDAEMQKRGRENCPKSLECKERGRSGRCATVDGLAQSTKLDWFLSGSIVIVGGSLGRFGRKRGFGQPSVEVARQAADEQTIDDDVGSRTAQSGVCVWRRADKNSRPGLSRDSDESYTFLDCERTGLSIQADNDTTQIAFLQCQ